MAETDFRAALALVLVANPGALELETFAGATHGLWRRVALFELAADLAATLVSL